MGSEAKTSMSPWGRRARAYKVLKGCRFIKDLDVLKRVKTKRKASNAHRPVSTIKDGFQKREQSKFVWKSCARKSRYNSQSEATSYMHRFESMYHAKGRVYYCDICNGWHIAVDHGRKQQS